MRKPNPRYFVGIDLAAENFMACVIHSPEEVVLRPKVFENTLDGADDLLRWFADHNISAAETVVCMESTGVYGEVLAYHLHAKGWWVAVQPPLEVKRAFAPIGHKNDRVDSLQIAEYAARYTDRLHRWQPKKEILEQIKTLLNLREQYVRQRTAHKNALRALQRKVVRTPLAEQLHKESIQQLNQNIQRIENEIRRLFEQDPDLHQTLLLLMSIPGVGFLLASHMVLLMQTLREPYNPRVVAAYVGIVPYEYSSGSSVQRKPRSRHFGPSAIQKLLHLAALSLRTHNSAFRRYYDRKILEGKPPAIAINNIANKVVRIMCAVARDQRPFIPNYRSVPPMVLAARAA